MTELVERKSSRRRQNQLMIFAAFQLFVSPLGASVRQTYSQETQEYRVFLFCQKHFFLQIMSSHVFFLLLRSSEALLFSILWSFRATNQLFSEAIILATSSHMMITISSYCRSKVLCDVFDRDLNEPICSNFLTKISPNKTI